MQFAYVKVKDPNSGLPKNVLIAWCGGGVPERTKGYFTSHLNAVAKVLHGYHVQITARSDSDLEPASIVQKVADASGAKYSSGGAGGVSAAAPPPVKSKPVFTPTSSSGARSINPIIAARSSRNDNVDADGWGADAPPVTRDRIEKVAPAYKPTKVDIASLTSQKPEPSRFTAAPRNDDADVVRGGYQPIGKVDIAALRAQAKKAEDDRPTTVKGAYEPVGKVDIAAIRAKAQKPQAPTPEPEAEEAPKPLADRAAAFSQPSQAERITSLPKPKIANKFGGASSFTGTKAPVPGGLGYGSPAASAPPTAATASRTFADQGGKTPAQIWAEKKAKERGEVAAPSPTGTAPSDAQPLDAQKSGSEWRSGYKGKSWAPVQSSSYGRLATGAVSAENTGEDARSVEETPSSPSGGISSLKDRFKDTTPIGSAPPPPAARGFDDEPVPSPPVPDSSRPSGGFALPGLPSRPAPADEEEEEEDPSAYQPEEREQSPVRVAIPVSRGPQELEKPEDEPAPPPVPPAQFDIPKEADLSDDDDAGRAAANAVAEQTFEPEQIAGNGDQGGHRAIVQYDYEKAEDNEVELIEGQIVTDIDMVDEDWWMGTNSKGERGLFPSNYVEPIEDDDPRGTSAAPPLPPPPAAAQPEPESEPEPEPEPAPAPSAPAAGGEGRTATALYDYEAAEDNGESPVHGTMRDMPVH